MTFMDELLKESEEKELQDRIEMSRLRADQILMALTVIRKKQEDVENLCEEEIKLIEQYRQSEFTKLQKQEGWLCFNLENYLRQTGEKTMRLVHGVIKLRNGRDKVEVTDLEQFLPFAQKKGLLRTVPEEQVPDLQALHAYIKRWGDIPAGVQVISGQTKFSYQLTTNGVKDDNDEQQAEGRVTSERQTDTAEVIERQTV